MTYRRRGLFLRPGWSRLAVRALLVLVTLLAARAALPAQPAPARDPLQEALRRGDYESAVARLQRRATRPEASPAARATLVELYLIIGWYDDAERVCQEWLEAAPEEPRALVCRARLARVRGDHPLAETLARRALAAARSHLPARLELVESLLGQGRRQDAEKEAGLFPQRLSALVDRERRQVRSDVSLETLLDVARGCTLYGLASGKADALKLAVQDLYPEARRRDPEALRGYLEPAALLLAKYNVEEARELYQQVLALNPNHPEAHLGLARCHWQANEREEARAQARAALTTNPHHAEAHALLARIEQAEGRAEEAQAHVLQALAVNPRLGEAWAVRMLLQLEGGDLPEEPPAELSKLPAPDQTLVYRALGDWLSDRRRYADGELQYQRALVVSPGEAATTAGLGLLHFRWGRYDQARETLERAFQQDSFNVRVYNALNVLDFLDECAEHRRSHLAVRAPQKQALLAGYLADFGEQLLEELLKQFEVESEVAVTVELFPDARLFSARVTALPGLDVNGACLGRVVVLQAPSAGERPFNWYDTLVHELTHAVCHLLAEGRAPQWFEEGLAVGVEGAARPRSWNLMLLHAQRTGALLPLGELDRSFLAAPASPERSLAYAQSQLAVEFLIGEYGWEKLLALLREARGAKNWAQTLASVLETTPHELDERYAEFLDGRCLELAARMALVTTLTRQLAEGKALDETSAEVLTRLLAEEPGAFEASDLRNLAQSVSEPELRELSLWSVLRLDRLDVEAALSLAGLFAESGRAEEAGQTLRIALGAGLYDPRIHTELAALALARGAREEAGREAGIAWQVLAEQGSMLEAEEGVQVWGQLSEVFAALGDEERSQQAAVRARAPAGGENGTGFPEEAP